MRNYWWSESLGRLTLKLTMNDVRNCSHSGSCDYNVEELSQIPRIKKQTEKWDHEILNDSLREFGAWDDAELSNHEQNVRRMLWIACNDVENDIEEN